LTTDDQIRAYIASQPEPKCRDLQALHQLVGMVLPEGKRWFLDGKNADGKVVSNPNIGYGSFTITYADGATKEFYSIGLSSNTGGISLYIMTIKDKAYLAQTYADALGKATVTGYCIKFKAPNDINLGVLEAAIRDGAARS
jgi:hypothetical protein